MESYIGFNLQFFTEKEKISGILNDFNIEKEIVQIDCNGIKKEIPISEILKINIISNDSSEEDSEDKSSKEGENVNKSGINKDKEDTKASVDEKENVKSTIKEELKNETKVNKSGSQESTISMKKSTDKDVKNTLDCIDKDGSYKNIESMTSNETKESKKSDSLNILLHQSEDDCKTLFGYKGKSMKEEINKQGNEEVGKDISKPGNTISRVKYKCLLNEAFVRYGPTVEEFICYGSLQIIKTCKSIIKDVNLKIDIILGDIPLFNRLGYVVARSLLLSYRNVCVVECGFVDVNTYKFKLTYAQNNGKISKTLREDSEIILCFCKACDIEKLKVDGLKKIIFVYEPPNNVFSKVQTILLGFGAIIEEYVSFKGDYYVLDVMISEVLYKKYSIRKGFSSSIMKLTANKK